jgi:hypothetical protein
LKHYLLKLDIAEVAANGSLYLLRPQVFYNGSLIIPDDGSTILIKKENSRISLNVLVTIQIMGAILIIFTVPLIVIYRRSSAVRKRSFISICIALLGSILMLITTLLINIKPNTVNCMVQNWSFTFGFTLIHNAILAREMLLHNVFKSTNAFKRRTQFQLYEVPIFVFSLIILLEIVRHDFSTMTNLLLFVDSFGFIFNIRKKKNCHIFTFRRLSRIDLRHIS